MNKRDSVCILGTKYKILWDVTEEHDSRMKDNDGFVDWSTKEIFINKIEQLDGSIKKIEEYIKKVLRHEIIHAFLYESGHEDYCYDETLVDLIAIQFKKIMLAFDGCDCL